MRITDVISVWIKSLVRIGKLPVFLLAILMFAAVTLTANNFLIGSEVMISGKDGKEYFGEVIGDDNDTVVLRTSDGKLTVKKSNIAIAEVVKNEEPEKEKISSSKKFNTNYVNPDNEKLNMIYEEIRATEEKMFGSAAMIYVSPLLTGALIGAASIAIKPKDESDTFTRDFSYILIGAAGLCLTIASALNYVDSLNTIGHLRAKKYDLMFLPFFESEKVADTGALKAGLGIEIRL